MPPYAYRCQTYRIYNCKHKVYTGAFDIGLIRITLTHHKNDGLAPGVLSKGCGSVSLSYQDLQ